MHMEKSIIFLFSQHSCIIYTIYKYNAKSCQHHPKQYSIYCIITPQYGVMGYVGDKNQWKEDDDIVDHHPYLSAESACVQVRGFATSL